MNAIAVRLALAASIFLLTTTAVGRAQSAAQAEKVRRDKPKEKKPPRVFTNDDLEEARKRPSAVQDLQAKEGTSTYVEPPPAPAPDSQPPPPPTPTFEEQQQAEVAAAEGRLRDLEARAKELLWQQLQSTESHEILRIKAEQQDVLNQIEAAKVDLQRLKGQLPPASEATPEPTREPG